MRLLLIMKKKQRLSTFVQFVVVLAVLTYTNNSKCQVSDSYNNSKDEVHIYGKADTLHLPRLQVKDSSLYRMLSEAFRIDSTMDLKSDSCVYLLYMWDTVFVKKIQGFEEENVLSDEKCYMFWVDFFPRYLEACFGRENYVGITYYRGHPILLINRKEGRYDTTLFSNTGNVEKISVYFQMVEDDWWHRNFFQYCNGKMVYRGTWQDAWDKKRVARVLSE